MLAVGLGFSSSSQPSGPLNNQRLLLSFRKGQGFGSHAALCSGARQGGRRELRFEILNPKIEIADLVDGSGPV
jgi:hypothetical protein